MSETDEIKILGFTGQCRVTDAAGLRRALSAGLSEMKTLLGARMTAMCGAAPGADLVFLRACVELRIPAIVILPSPVANLAERFPDKVEWKLAQDLMGVALARYVAPGRITPHLLDWADALLFAGGENGDAAKEARDLGIPSRIIEPEGFGARWGVALDAPRSARHGFGTRADLLDFLDARFGYTA
ncbi:hypothetical protein HZ994_10730 [Akkermansiaceae bacterium]|nr:hypothetical protein HZ994_10730 [Akkermansiaceae bacterium]